MSQEILPPEKGTEVQAAQGREVLAHGTALEVHSSYARRMPRLPPGGMIPSGRWWTFIDGPEDAFGIVSVNGNKLYFPQGDWIVLDEANFQAAVNSHLPMYWLDGMEVWEKTITDQPEKNLFNVITRRKVSDRPTRDQSKRYEGDHDPSRPPIARERKALAPIRPHDGFGGTNGFKP